VESRNLEINSERFRVSDAMLAVKKSEATVAEMQEQMQQAKAHAEQQQFLCVWQEDP